MCSIYLSNVYEKITVSPETAHLLKSFHAKVEKSLDLALEAMIEEDIEKAERVIKMKKVITDDVEAISTHGATRLLSEGHRRRHTYSREMEAVERLRRIYYFAKRIAKGVVAKAEAMEEDDWNDEKENTPQQAQSAE